MESDERPHDVQELSSHAVLVYEAVAALVTSGRSAGLADVVAAAGLDSSAVYSCLETLVSDGWLVRTPDGYGLGRHDWSVER